MESSLTSKTEGKAKDHTTSPARAVVPKSENGAPVGVPIFAQRSVPSLTSGEAFQLKGADGEQPKQQEEEAGVQLKLIIGELNDPYEREADQVGESVMAGETSGSSTHSADNLIQSKPATPAATSPSLPAAIRPAGSGTRLSSTIREKVEPLLGVDLSHVQVHTDAADQLSAKRLGAKAFTHQNHIWLGSHQSTDDVSLMAHELTHVVQQTGADGSPPLVQRQQVPQHRAPAQSSIPRPQPPQVVTAEPGNRAIDRATAIANLSLQHLDVIEQTLLPGFRRAVDAMDSAGASELATHIVGGLSKLQEGNQRITLMVPEIDPNGPQQSTPETDPFEHDPAEVDELRGLKSSVDARLATLLPRLAVEMSPQIFEGQPVMGAIETPPPIALNKGLAYVTFEVGETIDLLEEAERIEALFETVDTGTTSELPDEGSAKVEALTRVWFHRGRPVNFTFLVRVLRRKGIWQLIAGSSNIWIGGTGWDLERRVKNHSKEIGGLADIGQFDISDAHGALTYGLTDWAVTDANAMYVFEMLKSADPEGRARLIKMLDQKGLLGRLCNNLPWRYVQALYYSISDIKAANLLWPYWVGKGGGESLGQLLKRKSQEKVREDQEVRGFGYFFLNFFMDVTTFGGKSSIDEAYEQKEAGLISSDAYWSAVGKASARTVAVALASLATGGAAGAFGEGFATTLGASRGVAQLGGAVVGGAAGNVSAHFVGDVYDQMFSGKEGFDSIGDYGKDAYMGAGTGLILGGVGLAGAKFLPESALTMSQVYELRHPHLTKIFQASRIAGSDSAFQVKMAGRELAELFSSGGGPGMPGMRLAYVGAYSNNFANLAPDAEFNVRIRPLANLNRPMQQSSFSDEGQPVFEVEDYYPERAQAAQDTKGVAHDIGVQQGREAAAAEGLTPDAQWVNPLEDMGGPYGQGFDDVLVDADGFDVIGEYKGGAADLAPGQMERPWIQNVIDRMRVGGFTYWADRLQASLNAGTLRGVAFRTPIDPFTGVPGPTEVTYWQY